MSLADNAQHRIDFLTDLHRLVKSIEDCQTSIDIALQATIPHTTLLRLTESDTHLENARKELQTAVTFIDQIK